MVFEALHNLEPRGYVVGWIIAISLLVGFLIFLLLAVLLWKVSLETTGACKCPTQDTRSQASPGPGNLGRVFPSPHRYRGNQRPLQAEDGILPPLGPLWRRLQSPHFIYPQKIKTIPNRYCRHYFRRPVWSLEGVCSCLGSDLTMGDRLPARLSLDFKMTAAGDSVICDVGLEREGEVLGTVGF